MYHIFYYIGLLAILPYKHEPLPWSQSPMQLRYSNLKQSSFVQKVSHSCCCDHTIGHGFASLLLLFFIYCHLAMDTAHEENAQERSASHRPPTTTSAVVSDVTDVFKHPLMSCIRCFQDGVIGCDLQPDLELRSCSRCTAIDASCLPMSSQHVVSNHASIVSGRGAVRRRNSTTNTSKDHIPSHRNRPRRSSTLPKSETAMDSLHTFTISESSLIDHERTSKHPRKMILHFDDLSLYEASLPCFTAPFNAYPSTSHPFFQPILTESNPFSNAMAEIMSTTPLTLNPSPPSHPPLGLVHSLMKGYFEYAFDNSNVLLALHPQQFMHRLRSGKCHPMVLYSALAEAAQHVGQHYLADRVTAIKTWQRKARYYDDVSTNFYVIQSLCCLCGSYVALGDLRQAYLDCGRIIRILQTLGADVMDDHHPKTGPDPFDLFGLPSKPVFTDPIDKEVIRRIWWICNSVDRWSCLSLLRPLACNDRDMFIRLPRPDHEFYSGDFTSSVSPFLALDEDLAIAFSFREKQIEEYPKIMESTLAVTIRLSTILGRCGELRAKLTSHPAITWEEVKTNVEHMEVLLDYFYKTLNPAYVVELVRTCDNAESVTGPGIRQSNTIFIRLFFLAGRIMFSKLWIDSCNAGNRQAYTEAIKQRTENIIRDAREIRIIGLATMNIWSEMVPSMLGYTFFTAAQIELEQLAKEKQLQPSSAHYSSSDAQRHIDELIFMLRKGQPRWQFFHLYIAAIEQVLSLASWSDAISSSCDGF